MYANTCTCRFLGCNRRRYLARCRATPNARKYENSRARIIVFERAKAGTRKKEAKASGWRVGE